jgi:uncharacterized protein (TIGR02996 family)
MIEKMPHDRERFIMATTHEEAFLEDIVEHPDDDAPRLIYADWLEDNGDPQRAEFIRAQHALAVLPPGDPRRIPLLKRQDELLGLYEEQWRELPALAGVTWEDFSRGFVEAVFVETVDVFLEKAEALFAASPVQRVQIGYIDAQSAWKLARSPWLARVRELNLGNNPDLGIEGVRALAGSVYLGNLHALLLHYGALGDEAVSCLARSFLMGRLIELYLSGNELGDAGTIALGRAACFPRLTDLDLRDNQIGDGGVQALAHHGLRDGLTTLYLVNNRIGPEGAEALAFSLALSRLTNLYLNYNPIGNDGAVAFAESPHRRALRELDLRNCEIRDTGARALAESPHLDGVELLWLGGNRIRLEMLTLLKRRFGDRVRF